MDFRVKVVLLVSLDERMEVFDPAIPTINGWYIRRVVAHGKSPFTNGVIHTHLTCIKYIIVHLHT